MNTYEERERKREKTRREAENRRKGLNINNGNKSNKTKKSKMANRVANKEFAKITYAFVGLFLCMIGYISYYQIVNSDDVINSPYNPRQNLMASEVVRGQIQDRNGVVLAKTSVDENGNEKRVYPFGKTFAHVVGYSDMNKSGLELSENFPLLTSNSFFLEKIANEFRGDKDIGDNIITTLDSNIQKTAYDALGDNKGAVVVLDADTGQILTMVSKYSFDPASVKENWDSLNNSENSVMFNRATQGSYVPGSVFKIVTLLEFMRTNPAYASYTYHCDGHYEKDGVVISCAGNKAHGEQTLEECFANSCNSAFIDMGLQLNNDSLHDTAEELLFNSKLPGKFTSKSGSFVLNSSAMLSDTMMTAMGQGESVTNVYHMALITAAIANGGKLMTPYLVDSIENYTGEVVETTTPKAYRNLMTAKEAAALSDYMSAVVEYGTAQTLSGAKYTAAGKTGTAEYSSNKDESHSWFVGFTNVDNPDIVVSVIVEESNGGTRAVNVAKKIMDSYYK